MIYALTVALGFVFGAVDQYLGASWSILHLGFWSVSLSLMSAPWLALPFAAGATQRDARRAATLGLFVTLSALLGYFVMTLSPMEGVSARNVHLLPFLRSQLHVIGPGLLSGPVFGWLGGRWRTSRSWLSAAALAGAFLLEPQARRLVGDNLPTPAIARLEVGVGLALVAAFALVWLRARRLPTPQPAAGPATSDAATPPAPAPPRRPGPR
jgi:hypothetical protein